MSKAIQRIFHKYAAGTKFPALTATRLSILHIHRRPGYAITHVRSGEKHNS